MKLSIKDMIALVKIGILIVRYGKVVVESLGDIIEEIKTWFRDQGETVKPKPTAAALGEFRVRSEALVSAAKGKNVSDKELDKIGELLWGTNPETVKKLTQRRSGKTKRRA